MPASQFQLLTEGLVDFKAEPPGAVRVGLAGLAFVLTICTILSPIHLYTKRLCRPFLTRLVTAQLPWVVWAQRFKNPLLDVAVHLSAATVTIEFYISFLPILVWCGLEEIVYSLVTLLALVTWVAMAMKDVLESPRPADAPQPLKHSVAFSVHDTSRDIEDGLPSLHCSASVPMVLHSLRLAVRANLIPLDSALVIEAAALLWVAWVAWGRLYLGVHTPLDLASGTLLGYAVLELWQLSEAAFFKLLLHDPRFPLHLLLFAFLLMRCYPMPSRYTDCYQNAGAWGGAWCGAMLALWQHGYDPSGAAAAAAGAGAMTASTTRQGPVTPLPSLAGDSGPNYLSQVHHRAASAAAAAAATVLIGPSRSLREVVSSSSGSSSSSLDTAHTAPLLAAKIVFGLLMVGLIKVGSGKLLKLLFSKVFALVPLAVRRAWQPPIAAPAANMAAAAAAAAAGGPGMPTKPSQLAQLSRGAGRPGGIPAVRWSTGIGSSSKRLRCRPDGTPWDVATCARFCSYALAVNAVFQLNVWWPHIVSHLQVAWGLLRR